MEIPVAESGCLKGYMMGKATLSFPMRLSSSVVESASTHPKKSFIQEVPMEQRFYSSPLKKKMTYFFVKWEEIFTFATVLCGLSAIGSGIIWLFLKKTMLLYMLLGFSSGYFVGKNFWKFRHDFI